MTHRQEEAWLEWLDSREMQPDKLCFSIFQLTDVVANLHNTEGVTIDPNRWKMSFERETVGTPLRSEPEPELTQEDLDEQSRRIAFALIGSLGAGNVKGAERLDRLGRKPKEESP